MKLNINLAGTEAVRRTLLQIGSAMADKALAETAEDLELYIGNEAGKHTKTGALFRSVGKWRVPGGWEVGHDLQVAPYALFVHWGTRPHKILPKGKPGGKSVLRFPVGGQFAFAKGVNHPGYKGDPWLVRAAAMAPAAFERHVTAAIARINTGG